MRFKVFSWVSGRLPLDWSQNQVVELLPEDIMKLSEDWDVMIVAPAVRSERMPNAPPYDRHLFIDDRGRLFRQR